MTPPINQVYPKGEGHGHGLIGELMVGIKSDFWKDHWDRKRAKKAKVVDAGAVLVQYEPTARGGRIHVSCEYSHEFVKRAKELSGKWRARTKVWSFDACSSRLVVELCQSIYGKGNVRLKGFKDV